MSLPWPRFSHPRNRRISRRRKSTVQKYDQPYIKKPLQRSYSNVPGNNHPELAVLDNVNSKILTYHRMPSYKYDDYFVAYLANTRSGWACLEQNASVTRIRSELGRFWIAYKITELSTRDHPFWFRTEAANLFLGCPGKSWQYGDLPGQDGRSEKRGFNDPNTSGGLEIVRVRVGVRF